jgi:hypothetical protein
MPTLDDTRRHRRAEDSATRLRHDRRGVPRRDREGEETSTRLRTGQAQLGDLMYRIGDMKLIGGDYPVE